MYGFPKIVNGVSTIGLPSVKKLRNQMQNFPDRGSVRALRKLGVRTVVLHTGAGVHELPESSERPRPPDPDEAAQRPVADLGLVRHTTPDAVVYEVR